MQCKECKKEVGEDSFCKYCGKKVEKEYDWEKGFEEVRDFMIVQLGFFYQYPKIHNQFIKYMKGHLKKLKALKDKSPEKYDKLINSIIE